MKAKIEGDTITLKCIFESFQYGKVTCMIKIKDEVALAVFSDNRLAKDMYYAEKKIGIDDVKYQERLSCIGTNYPKKNKEEIAKILMKKFENHNIEYKEGKK